MLYMICSVYAMSIYNIQHLYHISKMTYVLYNNFRRYDAYLHVVKMNFLLCRRTKNVVLDSRICRERKGYMNNIWKEKFHKWNQGYKDFI